MRITKIDAENELPTNRRVMVAAYKRDIHIRDVSKV